ncbi:hypothetical protein [Mesomycoplasma neurolyticum]|uniref:Uncharacterized protein n=1 Tax=Mesomycoplasma neurolyticum TaxID=2120 RepID=A0A449A4I5_9BACT|nr:hypothetical protein [Mesomycoplasma neurolyticum]VEU59124.1 Uncharacterised protein [Mesomycoplasma neurolyticum]
MRNIKLKKINKFDAELFKKDYQFYLENLELKNDDYVEIMVNITQGDINIINLFYVVKYKEKEHDIFYFTYVIEDFNLLDVLKFLTEFQKNQIKGKVKEFSFKNFHFIKSKPNAI